MKRKPRPLTLDEVKKAHPLPAGVEATEPETNECSHGFPGEWHRWEWRPSSGQTEETSEPEWLESAPGCHACNCMNPWCERCNDE